VSAAAPPSGSDAPPPASPPGVGAPAPGAGAGADADPAPRSGALAAIGLGVRDALHPGARFLDEVGGHLLLCGRALAWLPRRPIRWRTYLEALEYIGFGSLPIILLVGVFTGMVVSLQMVFAFKAFQLESLAGGITGKAIALELGPVLTALMLAGRAGSGIATELGTMRISEQIDALESMAVNPIQFLVLPRLIAGMIAAPILALLFFVVSMGGAYFVAVLVQGVDPGHFEDNAYRLLFGMDVVQGLIKSVVFGFVVVLIGCYQGFFASGGGRGVGMGTTRTVVRGSVAVLTLDYFLTDILLQLLPPVGA
jgi:phospholipid/cholesterol/gamma-HCH transport system permease protein